MQTIHKTLLAASLLILAACETTDVFDRTEKSKKIGIPYNLPKTVIEVSLGFKSDGNNGQKLELKATPKRVPDKSAVYVLSPAAEDFLVSTDHHIVIEDGLLKSLDVDDTGELGEVIENVAETLINIGKTVTIAQSGEGNPFQTYQATPTRDEVNAIIEMMSGRGASFNFDPSFVDYKENSDLPGVGKLLKITVQKSDRTGEYRFKKDSPEIKKKAGRSGLYTRTLSEMGLEISLAIDMKQLNRRREEVYNKIIYQKGEELESLNRDFKEAKRHELNVCGVNAVVDFDSESEQKKPINGKDADPKEQQCSKEKPKLNSDETKICEVKGQIRALEKKLEPIAKLKFLSSETISNESLIARETELSGKLTKLKSKLVNLVTKCTNVKERVITLYINKSELEQKIAGLTEEQKKLKKQEEQDELENVDFVIAQSQQSLLVASGNAVEIPLSRANLGKTEFNLSFNKGILTSFEHSKPSQGKVLTESLVATSQALYDGVEEILKLPIKALGFKVEEEKAEQALKTEKVLNSQRDLEDKKQVTLRQAQLDMIKEDPLKYLDQIKELPPVEAATVTEDQESGDSDDMESSESTEESDNSGDAELDDTGV